MVILLPNRNVESHFSNLPQLSAKRSMFDRSSNLKTSFNVGDVIPIYIDEVLPGDTFRIQSSKVVRLQTMLTPIMDNIYLDTYFFYVPNRLVWEHWNEFCGEPSANPWIQPVDYTIPAISAPSGGFSVGTVADYLGLPVGVEWNSTDEFSPSALPFRAYSLICNDFFRDENLTYPLNISFGDSNQTGSNSDTVNGGAPFKASKYHDYFTSCLPAPQRSSSPVEIPVKGGSPEANFPVYAGEVFNGPLPYFGTSEAAGRMSFGKVLINEDGDQVSWEKIGNDDNMLRILKDGDRSANYLEGTSNGTYSSRSYNLSPNNLWTHIDSLEFGTIDINTLRLSIALQTYYEKLARGGARYIEMVQSFFGVTSLDAREARPQYLGGNRIPLVVSEVTNNAQTESDFLGDVGAKSTTSDIHDDFIHSFTEHGLIIGVCVARYDHSYPQGIERFWSRKTFTDFYLPTFANIGEQPVRQCEIFATASNIDDPTAVFGYQEPWAEYRYKPDRVTGEMRPGVSGSLAAWHLSDYYESQPYLSDEWIREDKTNVDRVLAVTSTLANQVFCDIYFNTRVTRPMPVYSIPSMIPKF